MEKIMERKILIVGANLVEKDGKYLLVQEAKEYVRGKWNFPAGKMDFGEKITQTAVRECKEETGFDVELEYLIGIFKHSDIRENVQYDVMPFVFKSNIIDGKLKSQENELLDVKWFTKDEIEDLFKNDKLR